MNMLQFCNFVPQSFPVALVMIIEQMKAGVPLWLLFVMYNGESSSVRCL